MVSPTFCILAGATLTSTIVTMVFTAVFAVALTRDNQPMGYAATVSSILSAVSLCCFGVYYVVYRRRRKQKFEKLEWTWLALNMVAILSTSAANCLGILVAIKMRTVSNYLRLTPLGNHSLKLVTADFFVIGFSILAGIAFFVYALVIDRKESSFPSATIVDMEEANGYENPNSRMINKAVMMPHQNQDITETSVPLHNFSSVPSSPTPSNLSFDGIRSWPSSLHQGDRRTTSKTMLLPRYSSARDSSSFSLDRHSLASVSQPEGFDSWDTSSVDPQSRDAVLQSTPLKRKGLEPIPGSRSASPAQALDGPFESEKAIEGSTSNTELYAKPYILQLEDHLADESNIHPLFRSGSPSPPPTATVGTVVTASMFGGPPLSRFTRCDENYQCGMGTNGPSPLKYSKSLDDNRLRHPSPPAREMTPPIPDFILSADRRSSSIAYGKRKASNPKVND